VNTLALPSGFTARALTTDDAQAVFELAARQEQHDLGKVEIEAADIVADWQRPSFDVGSRAVGVFDGQTMIGYGEFTGHERGHGRRCGRVRWLVAGLTGAWRSGTDLPRPRLSAEPLGTFLERREVALGVLPVCPLFVDKRQNAATDRIAAGTRIAGAANLHRGSFERLVRETCHQACGEGLPFAPQRHHLPQRRPRLQVTRDRGVLHARRRKVERVVRGGDAEECPAAPSIGHEQKMAQRLDERPLNGDSLVQ
jgi:hypothetical protein